MAKVILFQGDSITDALRDKTNDVKAGKEKDITYGYGYPSIVSGRLGMDFPEEYCFFNRGISGNRITDLYARIKSGILNLSPDVMSILIGVNDVWHNFFENPNGVPTDKFERIYTLLLEDVYEALPSIEIMLLEPFVLKAPTIEAYYDEFRRDVEDKAGAVRRIAEKFSLPFVELQAKFDALYNPENPTYWLRDGVHPTTAGHTLIADAWIEAFNKYFKA